MPEQCLHEYRASTPSSRVRFLTLGYRTWYVGEVYNAA